jgi:hypothetical protein
MKIANKTSLWVVVSIIVMAGVVIAMLYQSGLLADGPAVILLEGVEITAPTSTPAPAEGWWDEKPIPVSLN